MKRCRGAQSVLSCLATYESESSVYIVMPYCAGGVLNYKGKPKSEGQIRDIIKSVLEALLELNAKGYMHRDIKHDNIMYTDKGSDSKMMLIDVGFATKIADSNPHNVICGTPGYIAPEVLSYQKGKPLYNEKCDIFSLGVIFYELLTRKHLFHAKDIKEILLLNCRASIKFSSPKLNGYSEDCISLLQ